MQNKPTIVLQIYIYDTSIVTAISPKHIVLPSIHSFKNEYFFKDIQRFLCKTFNKKYSNLDELLDAIICIASGYVSMYLFNKLLYNISEYIDDRAYCGLDIKNIGMASVHLINLN